MVQGHFKAKYQQLLSVVERTCIMRLKKNQAYHSSSQMEYQMQSMEDHRCFQTKHCIAQKWFIGEVFEISYRKKNAIENELQTAYFLKQEQPPKALF